MICYAVKRLGRAGSEKLRRINRPRIGTDMLSSLQGRKPPEKGMTLPMYVEFFELRELPFNNTPDPRFFFSTPDHEEALASLIYAVQQRKGFVLLTGEIGAGKTLVSRMMLRHFNGSIEFATINHAVESAADLMEAVCTELQLPIEPGLSQTQLVRRLHDFLLAKFAQNVPVVLVLDEAQNLPLAAFEQLRMIGNLESDDAKLLQICIVGQPELQQIVQSPQVKQLRQRIFRSFHLPALDRRATEAYIRHRLSVAGAGEAAIFAPRAIDAVFAYSEGLPRLINAVCDNSLLSAYSAGKKPVDEGIVTAVVSQMMLLDGETGRRQAQRPGLRPVEYKAECLQSQGQGAPERLVGHPEANDVGRRARREQDSPAEWREVTRLESDESLPVFGGAWPVMGELAQWSRRAESLLQRLQTESVALQNREDRFRELASALRATAAEITRSLARVQRATEQSREAEAAARSAQVALTVEVERAAAATAKLQNRHPALADEDEFPVRTASIAPSPRRFSGPILAAATAAPPPVPADLPLCGLLDGTRQAIDGLREITGRDHIRSNGASTTGNGLAQQAETLLTILSTIPR